MIIYLKGYESLLQTLHNLSYVSCMFVYAFIGRIYFILYTLLSPDIPATGYTPEEDWSQRAWPQSGSGSVPRNHVQRKTTTLYRTL